MKPEKKPGRGPRAKILPPIKVASLKSRAMAAAPGPVVLSSEWKLQDVARVPAAGEAISQAAFQTTAMDGPTFLCAMGWDWIRKITYSVPESENLTISVNGVRVMCKADCH